MRLASYNVENLFDRVKAMNQESWAAGRDALAAYAEFNGLIQKPQYSDADKARMREILLDFGLGKSDDGKLARLRQNRGRLVSRPKTGGLRITANGRGDWIGWLELETEPVDEVATRNTARIIQEVNADVLAVVEAEDRIALRRFNEQVFRDVGGGPYRYVMLIDGNDDRGIDVGLLTREAYAIGAVCSHVDDRDEQGRIFSRDCPEYRVSLPGGGELWVLVNHLKSKGYGSQAANDARRRRQAERVRELYDARRADGVQFVAVVGDFNDTPNSGPLAPLLEDGSDLKDVSQYAQYQSGGFPGTFGMYARDKIDYILLSPELFARVRAAGVNRRGVWGGKNGDRWPRLEEAFDTPEQAASDHAAIWADIDL